MPTILTTKANDKSTFVINCTFKDEDNLAVIPNVITWTLTDEDGTVINSRTAQSVTPGASVDIALSGDDLKRSDGAIRILTVEATYNSSLGNNLPLKDQVKFRISDLTVI